MEERRKRVNPETREAVAMSFLIVDRIHDAEISKWMRGTHNFTIDTLVSIEAALGAPILQVYHVNRTPHEFEPMVAAEPAY